MYGHHQEPDAGVDTDCKWLAPRLLGAILANVFGKQKPGQLYVACIIHFFSFSFFFFAVLQGVCHLYIYTLKY